MQHMDGWALLNALKADPELRDIPAVVVSIVAHDKRGTILGVVDVLQKPVSREDLARALRHCVRPKILLVEDREDDQRIMLAYLAEHAGETRTAHNGREALQTLEHFSPDVVILDLLMPETDGVAFLQSLRSDLRFRGLPVFVVTARELSQAEAARLGQEAQAVLLKTDDLEQNLARVLQELLWRAEGQSPLDTTCPPAQYHHGNAMNSQSIPLLLVEDNPLDARMAQEMLSGLGQDLPIVAKWVNGPEVGVDRIAPHPL